MKVFNDHKGREWALSVNVASLKRLRDLTDVDLGRFDPDLLSRLHDDPILLVDSVYALCKPQAMERGVSDEQFGEAMLGEAIHRARLALLKELDVFFRGSRQQEVLAAMLSKATQIADEAVKRALTTIEQIDSKKVLDRISGKSSTPAPASAASTRRRSRSAS